MGLINTQSFGLMRPSARVEARNTHLMRQDFKKYIKMTEKIGLTVPEKIKLGYKHNWRLIMYKKVEKEVNNLKG